MQGEIEEQAWRGQEEEANDPEKAFLALLEQEDDDDAIHVFSVFQFDKKASLTNRICRLEVILFM